MRRLRRHARAAPRARTYCADTVDFRSVVCSAGSCALKTVEEGCGRHVLDTPPERAGHGQVVQAESAVDLSRLLAVEVLGHSAVAVGCVERRQVQLRDAVASLVGAGQREIHPVLEPASGRSSHELSAERTGSTSNDAPFSEAPVRVTTFTIANSALVP